MSLLDGALAAVFGAAFGALFAPGTLHKVQPAETGTGGFTVTVTDYPARFSLEAVGSDERAASGIPAMNRHLTSR